MREWVSVQVSLLCCPWLLKSDLSAFCMVLEPAVGINLDKTEKMIMLNSFSAALDFVEMAFVCHLFLSEYRTHVSIYKIPALIPHFTKPSLSIIDMPKSTPS